MQAFWSLKDAGGWGGPKVPTKRLWSLDASIFIPAQQTIKQYFMWKLTFSAKIWDIDEVAEAHSLASGGFGSDRGQSENTLDKNPKIANFWLTEM